MTTSSLAGSTVARHQRRRRLASYAVLLVALLSVGTLYAVFAPSGRAQTATDQSLAVKEGQQLFLRGCSTCHGINAQGGNQAPSLIGVGAAAVDFQVSTGRMPLANPGPEADRKKQKYTQAEIDQLAAYIASLAPGPAKPVVDVNDGDLTQGGDLFRTNCASCHNFAGAGGALSYGKYAPRLAPATDVQIAEAMRTGPESMPVFGPAQFDDHQVNSIVKYVKTISKQTDPGGNPLGRLGPIPEGMVVWLFGIGALVIFTLWIGARA
ncbi:MAG: cytochrome c [Actinomycetota bacterium]|nr:cytochrome c [Actinomycetota bacterium]